MLTAIVGIWRHASGLFVGYACFISRRHAASYPATISLLESVLAGQSLVGNGGHHAFICAEANNGQHFGPEVVTIFDLGPKVVTIFDLGPGEVTIFDLGPEVIFWFWSRSGNYF